MLVGIRRRVAQKVDLKKSNNEASISCWHRIKTGLYLHWRAKEGQEVSTLHSIVVKKPFTT